MSLVFRLGSLLVGILGALFAYQTILADPAYEVPITDFGRDLLGARAAQIGVNPYQTVGDLAEVIPAVSVSEAASDLWVAHSPISIAFARLWLSLLGPGLAEPVAESVQAISLIVVVLGTATYTTNRLTVWHGVAIGGATALTLGFRSDMFWLQGASLVAIGLALAYSLIAAGRRFAAVLLLGVLVAWRPWLAPLAVVLPDRDSWLKDMVRVGTIAVLATLLVTPMVGGPSALQAWLFDASSANFDSYLGYGWNLSLTGPLLPPLLALSVFGVVALIVAMRASRFTPEARPLLGVVVILSLSPLVWPHYWLALSPLFLVLAKQRTFGILLLAGLLLAQPIAESSPAMAKATSLMAVVALLGVLFTVWLDKPDRAVADDVARTR